MAVRRRDEADAEALAHRARRLLAFARHQSPADAADSFLEGAERVLREMQAEGDYPRILWRYADAVATSRPIKAGKPLSIE
jgi:hypothetical protein